MDELLRKPAREVVRLLGRREVGPVELVRLALERIAAVDPLVNAVPTVCAERALAQARAIEAAPPPEDRRGWLAGLPVVIKDMNDVAGVRTTYGSPIFADHVPERSGYEIERLEAQGAVILGKSNVPEFAAGANTFNEVFGATLNPWDRRMTCGGSSGGSAVALATGMAWLANGSDLGGSLRTPASYCSVVGLRPSPGRVAHGPSATPFQTLTVEGPMARDVRDAALLLDAQAGLDPRDPLELRARRRSPSRPRSSARCRRGGSPSPTTSAGSRRSTPRWRRSAGPRRGASPSSGPRSWKPARTSRPPPRRSPSCAPSRSWPAAARCWSGTATASSPRWCGTSSGASA